MDIVVCTPKTEMANAAQEAEDAKAAHARGERTFYFRRLASFPKKLSCRGGHVWWVEDGYLRGYAKIELVSINGLAHTCDTTGVVWPPGVYVSTRPETWRWIKPIKFAAFRGWRYFLRSEHKIEEVGGWLDPKPEVTA